MGIGVSAWRSWKLDGHRYAYIWVDGVYLGDGVDREKTALLCVVGAREGGVKELLGMELGYRESTESWSGVLRSLSPNPPKGACERRPEEAKGCTFESEIMVLNQKTCHRKGAPNRCYHVTTLTASKSPSTIPAW